MPGTSLNDRLAGGDTLIVVAIDRIGRTLAEHRPVHLRPAGPWASTVRSLAESEAQWTRYLEADEGSPEDLLRPGPDHVRGLGGRPRAGVCEAPDQGGPGSGPPEGEDPGTAQKVPAQPGGSDA